MAKRATSKGGDQDAKPASKGTAPDARPQVRNTPPPPPPSSLKGQHRPYRSAPKPSLKPRRVRGGVKLKALGGPGDWAQQRITALCAQASEEARREGVEYAKVGQTKKIDFAAGVCSATVQGRMPRAYAVELKIEPFDAPGRERMIAALGENPRLSAILLGGELPESIEELLEPLGLRMCPSEPGDLKPSCTCADWSLKERWCKHAVCAASLLGETVAKDPFVLIDLRGPGRGELLELLRDQRAMGAYTGGPVPVYAPHVPGASDYRGQPLDETVDSFWSAGPGLDTVDAPLEPPPTSHVLLRRLGPSPFAGRFPLVGLLATCYELISQDALKIEDDEPGDEG